MNQKYLRECFEYLPETGQLVWKERPLSHFKSEREWKLVNKRQKGKIAGTNSQERRYQSVKIGSKLHYIHRIVVMLHGIQIPSNMCVDHINGNSHDNRIENLRVSTFSKNSMNQRMSKHNTSGHHGIQWRKDRNKWTVRLIACGKIYRKGHFSDINDAIKARDLALVELGFSDRHGKERGA